jgi:biopolymer transport protein ExbB
MGDLARLGRSRWLPFSWVSLIALVLVVLLTSGQPARAQEEGNADNVPTAAPPEAPNFLMHMIKSAGPVFGPIILVISLGLVALIVLLAMDLRLNVAIPPDFVEEFTDTVNKRRFKEAFDLAKNDTSFLARVLTAGMGRLQYGLDDAREVVGNTVESIKAGKEHLITYLATIGTLGPLIGLVGTVYGMILAFMELQQTNINAGKLASAISHALVLTLLGVALSVPAIFCHAFFRNRLIRISNDTGTIADDLLTQMYHNSRKPTAPSPSASTTPSAAATAAPASVKPVQA